MPDIGYEGQRIPFLKSAEGAGIGHKEVILVRKLDNVLVYRKLALGGVCDAGP